MDIGALVIRLIQGGLGNLAAYLAAHVLLCLVPAFFIAGALTALVPKEADHPLPGAQRAQVRLLPGGGRCRLAAGGLLLHHRAALCRHLQKGRGLGPAITFLFFAPAANILALAYTGVAIGADLAIARLVLSLTFGIGIGMIMALIFSKEDVEHDEATNDAFAGQEQGAHPRVGLPAAAGRPADLWHAQGARLAQHLRPGHAAHRGHGPLPGGAQPPGAL